MPHVKRFESSFKRCLALFLKTPNFRKSKHRGQHPGFAYDTEDTRYARDESPKKVLLKIGHSTLYRNCNVNMGKLLTQLEGGEHVGAGSRRFHVDRANEYIPQIMDALLKNKKQMD